MYRVKKESGKRFHAKGYSNSLFENKLPMPWHKKQKNIKTKTKHRQSKAEQQESHKNSGDHWFYGRED